MAQYMRGNETVFETPDVEREQEAANVASTSITEEGARDSKEGIDVTHIQPGRSFEVFQGKVFTLPSNDFSIANSAERRVESPLQRFVRLRQELTDLKFDLDLMAAGSAARQESSVWSVLQAEAGGMVEGLRALESHPHMTRSGPGPSTLTAELRDLSTAPTAAPIPVVNAPAGSADNTNGLEQRLHALETLLGATSNMIDVEAVASSRVADGAGVFPLVESVARMERRISMLSDDAIDRLRIASATLRADLEATNREKNKNIGPEQKIIEAVGKLDDLYKKIQLASGMSQDLPALIVRLKTLQRLHSETANFSVRVSQLENAAEALQAQTANNAGILQDMKEGFASNVSTMISNIEQIDQRILELREK